MWWPLPGSSLRALNTNTGVLWEEQREVQDGREGGRCRAIPSRSWKGEEWILPWTAEGQGPGPSVWTKGSPFRILGPQTETECTNVGFNHQVHSDLSEQSQESDAAGVVSNCIFVPLTWLWKRRGQGLPGSGGSRRWKVDLGAVQCSVCYPRVVHVLTHLSRPTGATPSRAVLWTVGPGARWHISAGLSSVTRVVSGGTLITGVPEWVGLGMWCSVPPSQFCCKSRTAVEK